MRVWHFYYSFYGKTAVFQLTHPWGCDISLNCSTTPLTNFNSHTREGVTSFGKMTVNRILFQLTHPWGCDKPINLHTMIDGNFNSHTREGVTNPVGYMNSCYRISTHTPVRVWLYCSKVWRLTFISTHTPVRVWLWYIAEMPIFFYFNSHTREGVTYFFTGTFDDSNFNSHTREGVTKSFIPTMGA